ncbi:MAG TPA: C-terminal binding protein, partial [Micromonosporaceae bacterium]
MTPSHTVVISERLGRIGPDERNLEAAGATVRSEPLWSRDALLANAADATVLLVGSVEPVTGAVLAELPQCVAVVRRGVGHDNVDVEAATELGVVVANVPDASVEEVSDHAIALLFALERRIVALNAAVHEGVWNRDPAGIVAVRAGMRRLASLTLGVIGFGRIGRATVRKALPTYARVLVHDPLVTAAEIEAAGAVAAGLDEVYAGADHLSLHASLGSGSRKMIDEAAVAQMRPGAMLVNTARGGMLDEAAVVAAIRAGHLGGLGLDVTEHEPIGSDDPLLTTEGVLLTAHSGAFSTTSVAELRQRALGAVDDILHGRVPAAVVNRDVLASPALRAKELTND